MTRPRICIPTNLIEEFSQVSKNMKFRDFADITDDIESDSDYQLVQKKLKRQKQSAEDGGERRKMKGKPRDRALARERKYGDAQ